MLASAPNYGGDGKTAITLVQKVSAVIGPPPVGSRHAKFRGNGVGISDQLLQPGGAGIEYFLRAGLSDQQSLHVLDEVIQRIFYGGHVFPC